MNYRIQTEGAPIGAYLARKRDSILPEYTPVGSTVLPRYFPIGDDAPPETPIVIIDKTGTSEEKAANVAALRAGMMFCIGLALGYIWGGTTAK